MILIYADESVFKICEYQSLCDWVFGPWSLLFCSFGILLVSSPLQLVWNILSSIGDVVLDKWWW